MVVSTTVALIATGILALSLSSTRAIGIAVIFAVTFAHPAMAICVIAGVGVAIYLKHFR